MAPENSKLHSLQYGSFETEIDLYRCTMHSDIHTVYSPTDAHLLTLCLKLTLKLDGCYMFRSTTIFRELAIEPG